MVNSEKAVVDYADAFYGYAQPNVPLRTAQCLGKIVIAGDEPAVLGRLHRTLFSLGFDVTDASARDELLELCRLARYDAVLIDINTPRGYGVDMCRELRRLMPRLAILVVSVYGEEENKVEALEAGADDYITKPFQSRELTARIRASVRKSKALAEQGDEPIAIGEIEVFPSRRLVRRSGRPVHLTPKEFDLLHFLMTRAGMPVAHARLLRAIWGPSSGNHVDCLRTFMRQLRKKLEDHPEQPRYLLTESHIGYRFVDPAVAPEYGERAGAA